ncbi:uncharacterized protein LOC107852401 [Capsicum annuum]|uniref:uncharacterized protein LOC107852401 n=1 Tax=Capsicum annuum TaxID=4072 RepID=UPI001FB0E437|nr:uncharacterized protein LOC107852401 [Capsicum annuum]
MAPPVFDGDNYQTWAVKMENYLKALDLWKVMEEDYEVQLLPKNPTVAQIKSQKEKKTKKSKAKACLFAAISPMIFTRIISLKLAKAIWDYLKTKYRKKESEPIKEYRDRLLSIANKVRLLGSELTDSRIVEKLLVLVSERFEATIKTLENTKYLPKISFKELLNALQAQEQRRALRQNEAGERALPAKHQDNKYKRKKNFKN